MRRRHYIDGAVAFLVGAICGTLGYVLIEQNGTPLGYVIGLLVALVLPLLIVKLWVSNYDREED